MRKKKLNNHHLHGDLYLISSLLDSVGPEASLGREAWERIAGLDLTSSGDLALLVNEYILPEFKSSPTAFQTQILEALQRVLFNAEVTSLEGQIVQECPYMEKTPPRLLFSVMKEELKRDIQHCTELDGLPPAI